LIFFAGQFIDMEKVPVIIYEDEAPYREGLCWLLAADPQIEVKGAFSNADNILEDVKTHKPKIILTDLNMPPGINGIEAIRLIRENGLDTLVVVLTAFEDDETIFDAIQVGANGYLVKSNAANDLIDSLMMVLEGGAPMSPRVAARVLNFVKNQPSNRQPAYVIQLTIREKEILKSLTEGNSHKMIAAEYDIALLTVRNHLRHIYEKLRVHSATEAVAIALKYRLV
jgi:DNA-binding NarL/FixJ family response regulator